MPFQVDFSEGAVSDLADIESFIASGNPDAASQICRELYDTALALGLNPFLGRTTPEYANPAIRDFVHGNYRIVYHLDESEQRVYVVRFWHGARGYLP